MHELKAAVERLSSLGELQDHPEARQTFLEFRDALTQDRLSLHTQPIRSLASGGIERYELLAKSLRPPPEKRHGLKDVETRFRRRELDLIANEDARDLFILRARAIAAIRSGRKSRIEERYPREIEPLIVSLLRNTSARLRPAALNHSAE